MTTLPLSSSSRGRKSIFCTLTEPEESSGIVTIESGKLTLYEKNGAEWFVSKNLGQDKIDDFVEAYALKEKENDSCKNFRTAIVGDGTSVPFCRTEVPSPRCLT